MQFPTQHEVTLLKLLDAAAPEGAHASELVAASAGKVQRASVYTTLTRMQGKGFARTEGPAYHRRWKVTALGQRALAAAKMLTKRSA